MPRPNRSRQWESPDVVPFGYLDTDGVWLLPVHQPVEGNDFSFNDWRDLSTVAPTICELCSYDQRTGLPRKAVLWPCPTQVADSTVGDYSETRKMSMPRNTLGLLPSIYPYIGPYRPLTLTPDRLSSPSTSAFSYVASLLPLSVLRKIGLAPL